MATRHHLKYFELAEAMKKKLPMAFKPEAYSDFKESRIYFTKDGKHWRLRIYEQESQSKLALEIFQNSTYETIMDVRADHWKKIFEKLEIRA